MAMVVEDDEFSNVWSIHGWIEAFNAVNRLVATVVGQHHHTEITVHELARHPIVQRMMMHQLMFRDLFHAR